MNKFWKVLLAVVAGTLIVHLLYFFLFFGVLGSLVSTDSSTELGENSILQINLSEEMPDKVVDNMTFDFQSMKQRNIIGLNDALKAIEKAKTDDRIKGIYLDLSSVSLGYATAEELRAKLLEFKSTGKFIVSYSTAYSQLGYYLASVSDEIYINPQGGLSWQGMCTQIMFYKNLLDKFGVEMQIFRHGQFKSAVEPFMTDKMSDANRKQYRVLLNSMWSEVCAGISEQRGIWIEDLNKYADSLAIRKPQDAVDLKFVDGLKYYDEMLDLLKTKSGNTEKNAEDMFVSLSSYCTLPSQSIAVNTSEQTIAVLFAEGEIVDGTGEKGQMGGDKIAEELRKIREDENVKALVLRVNSPGGSGLASEIMWRELQKVKEAGKPIVVSMGNYAASGGYYISCSADYIFAQPTTLTGSIGVFGMFPCVEKLVTETIGITVDTVSTNTFADFGSLLRPVSETEHAVVQQSVEDFYELFITRVYDGRKGKGAAGQELATKELVDSIGQGRVWSGADAIAIGLVDELGNLNAAVKKASELANLGDNYKLEEFPAKKEWYETLTESFDISTMLLEKELGESYNYYKAAKQASQMRGVQARMEHDIIIK